MTPFLTTFTCTHFSLPIHGNYFVTYPQHSISQIVLFFARHNHGNQLLSPFVKTFTFSRFLFSQNPLFTETMYCLLFSQLSISTFLYILHYKINFCLPFFHYSGWQKLRGSTGGTRRKVWTRTKILSPNIRYFGAN